MKKIVPAYFRSSSSSTPCMTVCHTQIQGILEFITNRWSKLFSNFKSSKVNFKSHLTSRSALKRRRHNLKNEKLILIGQIFYFAKPLRPSRLAKLSEITMAFELGNLLLRLRMVLATGVRSES